MPILHLVCGLPGSGKSTLAKKLKEEHKAFHLIPDEWMERIVGDGYNEEKRAVVEAMQWEIAQQVLRLGNDVILEFGFWSRKERDDLKAQAESLGATTKLYFFDVSREELLNRLEERNKNLPLYTFRIEESRLDDAIKNFEPPTPEELE